MVSLVADPFASSLLALLRHGSAILLEDCVDPVVWQLDLVDVSESYVLNVPACKKAEELETTKFYY
jgi:hypothetical protein